jgi:hypothetical protein
MEKKKMKMRAIAAFAARGGPSRYPGDVFEVEDQVEADMLLNALLAVYVQEAPPVAEGKHDAKNKE